MGCIACRKNVDKCEFSTDGIAFFMLPQEMEQMNVLAWIKIHILHKYKCKRVTNGEIWKNIIENLFSDKKHRDPFSGKFGTMAVGGLDKYPIV